MKILKADTVVDRLCDVCEKSVYVNIGGQSIEECGEFRASLGYGSKQDGKCYQVDLCEGCFMTAFHALQDKRRVELMFSDENSEMMSMNHTIRESH